MVCRCVQRAQITDGLSKTYLSHTHHKGADAVLLFMSDGHYYSSVIRLISCIW